MEFEERVNLRDVHYLNSMTFDTYKQYVNDDASRNGVKSPAIKDMKVLFDYMKRYCQTAIKTRGITKRIYSYSLNTPDGTGGRLFSGGSLQNLTGIFRSVLFNGISATDIDQENSHPTILRYICRKHDILCPNLEFYINNRDRCLAEFASRTEGKKAFLVATNTDKKVRTHSNALKQYDAEMKRIQREIVALDEYKLITSSLPIEKVNYYGSAMNRILCYYENVILQHAINAINRRGVEIAVLMFDGCVIYGNHYFDVSLLNDITSHVNEQMPNLNMKWTYKPFNTLVQVPPDFNHTVDDTPPAFRMVMCEKDAADLIYEELKDRLIPAKKRLFFKQDNVWADNLTDINNYLLDYILKSNITKVNEDKKYVPYAQNVKTAKNIREALIVKVKSDYHGVDLYEKFHSTTKGRIAFEDGVLDFPSKRFYEWDEVDFEYYTTKIVHRKFGEWFHHPNQATIDDIVNKIFTHLFGQKLNTAIQFLSRAIAGHIEDKNFATYLGSRDCGKGVIFELLRNAFGDYIGSFELGNMLYERASRTQETSRMLYWLLDYEFIRIAISQETPSPDRNLKVNSEMVKKICGGGDEQTARRNFDTEDTRFKLDTTLMMMGNYALNFDSPDVMEHCLEFNSTVQFKAQSDIDAMRANFKIQTDMAVSEMREEKKPEDEISGFITKSNDESQLVLKSYLACDDTIKDCCRTEDWMNACVYLLLQNYSATAVSCFKRCEDDDDDDVSIRKLILQRYDITRDVNDIVLVIDVVNEIGSCKKKITNEVVSFGVEKRKSNARDRTKDKMCFYGMKLKPQEKAGAIL